jgi:hypothetical protein
MGAARAIGAAASPFLFGAYGLTGPIVVAVTADVIAAGLLLAWVRDVPGETGASPAS